MTCHCPSRSGSKVPTTDAPSVLRDSDYPYYGRIDWFPAEELFDGDHPSRPRERWLELVDDWLPHVRDSIIKMRDDPVAAEERRVQPSSMVFETDEYSHWAKFIDENQRTRLFHFDIQKPRNHRLSALGLPFAPNDGCDLSDFDTYPLAKCFNCTSKSRKAFLDSGEFGARIPAEVLPSHPALYGQRDGESLPAPPPSHLTMAPASIS